MRDGKYIVARLWPKFGGNIPSILPVILGVNPQKYETIGIYLTKNSDIPNLLEQNGKKIFFVTQNPKLPAIRPLAIFKLVKILKEQKVDILHCHHHISAVYGAIAGRLAKVPVILTHVHGMGRTRNIRRKLLNRFILPKIDKILAISEAVKNDIIESNLTVKPEQVVNLSNSIDYDYYSQTCPDRAAVRKKFNIPQDAFVVATAGRLVPTKGQKFLIEAFTQVKKQIPNALLLLAGTGDLKEALEKQTGKLGCGDSVRFLGRIDNILEFYNTVDVFALPSIAEGFGRSLAEAMAAGVLCIASNVGGMPEILDNGKYGLLVEPQDSDGLAGAVLKLANMSAEEKTRMISAAKERVKKEYSHEIMIKGINKIYDELVSEKIREDLRCQ